MSFATEEYAGGTDPDDGPRCPRVNEWRDGSEVVREWVWTHPEWEAMAEADRPGAAQPLRGIGYSLLRRYPAEE